MIAWLVTWLWQGLALVASVSLVLRLGRRLDAGTRYVCWCAGLVMLLWLGWPVPFDAGAVSAVPPPEGAAASRALVTLPALPVTVVLAIGAAWLLAAALGLTRLCGLGYRLWRLKGSCEPFPRARENRLVLWCRERARGRRARLMLSDAVPGPTVLGLVRPCIVVPRRLVDRLGDEDLDRVALHELAHVRRWDDWARLMQSVVEIVAGFHPAVWWAGRALSLEREVACDQWVVARSGAPRPYARCLHRVAVLESRTRSRLLPAFVGRRSDLVRRVDRLLEPGRGRLRRGGRLSLMAAGVLAVAILSAGFHGLPPLVAERATAMVRAALPAGPRALAMAVPGFHPKPAEAVPPPLVVTVPLAVDGVARPSLGSPAADGSADRLDLVAVRWLPAVSRPLIQSTPIVAIGSALTLEQQPSPPADIRELMATGNGSPWAVAGSVGVTIGATLRVAGVTTAEALTSAGRSVGRWFGASARPGASR